MPEVKYTIKTEADLSGITATSAALDKLTAAEVKAATAAKQHKADIKGVTLEQFNLDSATVGTARAMGKAAEETNKAAGAKRGMIPLLGMLTKGANAAGAGIGFLSRSFGILKVAMLSTGWGLILGAIGALVGWVIKLAGTSDQAKDSVGKLTEKINTAAEAQFKFAKGTREATLALEDQDQAEIGRIADVERAKLDAGQTVERAQLDARIASGAITPEEAIGAKAALDARQRAAKDTLDERIRSARMDALARTKARTQTDVDVARGELGSAEAAVTTPFEELPFGQQILLRARRITPSDIAARQQAKIEAARANLTGVESGAGPILERIRQSEMDIGAERMVAGFRSTAAAQTGAIESGAALESEKRKQIEATMKLEQELTRALERIGESLKQTNSRSRVSRD